MPWDGSDLWVVDVQRGRPRSGRPITSRAGPTSRSSSRRGRPTARSCSSPTGPAGGTCTAGGAARPTRSLLAPIDAEFAGPQWVFGLRWFDIAPDGTIVAVASEEGVDTLHVLAPGRGSPGGPARRDVDLLPPGRRRFGAVRPGLRRRARAPSRASTCSSGRVERLHEANRLPGRRGLALPAASTSRSRARTGAPPCLVLPADEPAA